MDNYIKIRIEIEKIKNERFDYGEQLVVNGKKITVSLLLRKVLLLYNDIKFLVKNGEKNELIEMLDDIMKNKLLSINPNLSDIVLNQIILSFKRRKVVFPLDYYVISNAVVFKEIILDNDIPYEIKTFILSNNGEYFNILDNIYFTLKPAFDDLEDEKKYLIYEKNALTFIINNINYIIKSEFNKNMEDLNIYLNKHLYEIVFSIKENYNMDFELILHDDDKVILYNIIQNIEKGKPIWIVSKSNNPVWILSEACIEKENNKEKKYKKN